MNATLDIRRHSTQVRWCPLVKKSSKIWRGATWQEAEAGVGAEVAAGVAGDGLERLATVPSASTLGMAVSKMLSPAWRLERAAQREVREERGVHAAGDGAVGVVVAVAAGEAGADKVERVVAMDHHPLLGKHTDVSG
mmetsp:Transcript_13552/g.23791  ORF Transcript_13552/g.23791 Transcript_13552/m.23791 type:complete len:137 (+) Transcript_13552:451-861(+)